MSDIFAFGKCEGRADALVPLTLYTGRILRPLRNTDITAQGRGCLLRLLTTKSEIWLQ